MDGLPLSLTSMSRRFMLDTVFLNSHNSLASTGKPKAAAADTNPAAVLFKIL
jgi:hypothetical protein